MMKIIYGWCICMSDITSIKADFVNGKWAEFKVGEHGVEYIYDNNATFIVLKKTKNDIIIINNKKNMKVALIHDHLAQDGGAEKVLEVFSRMIPEAVIYTLLYDKNASIFCANIRDNKIFDIYEIN